MKYIRYPLLGLIILILSGTQAAAQGQDEVFTKPAAGSVEKEDFVGAWKGYWGGKKKYPSTLTIRSINPIEGSYCYGSRCAYTEERQNEYRGAMEDVELDGNTLRFKWGKSKFRFRLKGDSLRGRYARDSGDHQHVARIRMKKLDDLE